MGRGRGRNRRRRRANWLVRTTMLAALGGVGWAWWSGWGLPQRAQANDQLPPAVAAQPAEPAPVGALNTEPAGLIALEDPDSGGLLLAMGPQSEQVADARPTPPAALAERSEHPQIHEQLQRAKAGDLVGARTELNRLLQTPLPDDVKAELRTHLARLADMTIFSRRKQANDPLVENYRMRAGDVLVRVAPNFHVPAEAILMLNGLKDPGRLREGQQLSIPKGPFHARISKSAFRMDLYLQETYVRSYPVGLGADAGTPTGLWRVKERLRAPTYYPPQSATNKRIIPPNDPENPLGGFWIGLEGVDGDAVGQEGFGVHGTIEPESIGKNASLGCVRMYNHDVAVVFDLLQPGQSTVTTLP